MLKEEVDVAERNWGLIQNGEVFEALATTIIFFNDPNAVLLGRPGADGGQDAKSGDGRIIYQAKFHKGGSARQAIKDAKSECRKIEKYREKESERYDQWKNAQEWILVTNLSFNPAEHEAFESQVIPMFASLGLKALYWERARLDIFLDLFVEVSNSYFGQAVRSFLSLGEAKIALQEELAYLGRTNMPDFVGRDKEMLEFKRFLDSDSFFFTFHGAGGIGKTRLLYESGLLALQEMKWQVLWANVATMENTSAWFTTVVPERPTLLLIDEPDSDVLLRLIFEQVGRKVGRAAGWKVAIAVRSPKDPVLKFLSSPKNKTKVKFLAVKALPSESAIEFCEGLLLSGKLKSNSDAWRERASIQIATSFSSHPIWISIAVSVLERDGDLSGLPNETSGLMAAYYEETILGLSPEVVSLINYVALMGVVNKEQQDVVDFICKETGLLFDELYSGLSVLIGRGLVVRRGANQRLYEIKPDVIRDFIVRRWLVDSHDEVSLSRNARVMMDGLIGGVLGLNFSVVQRNFLSALVRTELVLIDSGVEVSFLRHIYDAVKSALSTMNARERLYALDVLTGVASFSSKYALLLSKLMRKNIADPCTKPGFVRAVDFTQDDVVKSLGWFVYHAAHGVEESKLQQNILGEMLELALLESEIERRTKVAAANDGKSAKVLLERVIVGGPEYLSDFGAASHAMVDRLYELFIKEELQRDVIGSIFEALTTVRRHQAWYENNAFNTQVVSIQKNSPAWKTRDKIVSVARKLLRDNEDLNLRISLWGVLASAHSALNQCRLGELKQSFDFESDVLDDLRWVESILTEASQQMAFGEICAARKIWQWHVEYEEDGSVRLLSKALESLYIGTELASEFDSLFKFDVDYQGHGKRVEAKAAEIAGYGAVNEVVEFLERAVSYLSISGNMNALDNLGYNVGFFASESSPLKDFSLLYLSDVSDVTLTKFASCIAQQMIVVSLSKARDHGFELLQEFISACAQDSEKAAIIKGCYSFASRNLESMLPAEHEYVRRAFDTFKVAGNSVEFFVIVGWGFSYDWDGYKAVIYSAFKECSPEIRKVCLESLFRSIYSCLRDFTGECRPEDLNVWMFFLIKHLAYLEDEGQLTWLMSEIFKETGDVPLTELAQALDFRMEVENQVGGAGFKAASYSGRLSQYVEKVTDSNFNDESIRGSMAELVSLMSRSTGSIRHYFSDILRDVDPSGLLVPEMIYHEVEAELDRKGDFNFRRVINVYPVNSSPWRHLASAVLSRAQDEWPDSEEQNLLYSYLLEHGVRSYSRTLGQVSQFFIDEVRKAECRLESEKDEMFIPFFEWSLRVAQHELDIQIEQAKEERGE